MNPPEDENSITIDPYGDRSLIIGDGKNQKRFLVSSNAMRLASPIWKSMFTGPYKEGTATEIPFPEGKPDAFLITLQIAHLRFADLPSLLDFQGLVNLAIVCDEYDMVPTICAVTGGTAWPQPRGEKRPDYKVLGPTAFTRPRIKSPTRV
jgi:hypothetical protein